MMLSGIFLVAAGLFNFVVGVRRRIMDARQGGSSNQSRNSMLLGVMAIVMGSGWLVGALGAPAATSGMLAVLGGVISIVLIALIFRDMNRGTGDSRG